jgi:hypothetical protein
MGTPPPLIYDAKTIVEDALRYMVDVLTNPLVVLALIIIVGLYLARYALSAFNNQESAIFSAATPIALPAGDSMTFTGAIVVVLAAIILARLLHVFWPSIRSAVQKIFHWRPLGLATGSRIKAAKTAVVPEILLRKQVYNIPGNTHGYDDAKALCSAYGSRLATYKEIESAYEHGGEWCNYGWSDGQMALFPTQQKTFDELQKIDGHENDCGRPGINGGYMENPRLKFGVNCYGYKPQITPEEEHNMATIPHYPKTKKDIAMETRVSYWKNKLADVIVAPFNYNNWSRI